MADFNKVIDLTLQNEGSTFTNDINDPGGATKYGITLATLKGIKPEATVEDIKNLTKEEASNIYKQFYWSGDSFISQAVASKNFDMAVNLGKITSIKMLQEACNEHGASLVIDGKLGPNSINTINSVGEISIVSALCSIQANYYWNIVEANVSKHAQEFGWPLSMIEQAASAIQKRDLSTISKLVHDLKAKGLKLGTISFIAGWLNRANQRFGV